MQAESLPPFEEDDRQLEPPSVVDHRETNAEQDFHVENNPFAFTPGQLNKLQNPKSLAAWRALGGLQGLEKGLDNDLMWLRRSYKDIKPQNILKFKNKAEVVTKVKRGLASLVNGVKLSVLADTGASHNVLSAKYAKSRGLEVDPSSTEAFRLGNSTYVDSIGTAKIEYAFAEEPSKIYHLTCHVLRDCVYDLILGSSFLAATETLSKFRHRISNCAFKVLKFVHMAYMGTGSQLIEGTIAGSHPTSAVPDTGAECNVMDLEYAERLGLTIHTQTENRGHLRFADDTIGETIGQVHTTWRFQSGEEVPITFAVLENCCFNLVIGEDMIWEHDIFNRHASSILSGSAAIDAYRLAPFAYEKFQQKIVRDSNNIPSGGSGKHNPFFSLYRSLNPSRSAAAGAQDSTTQRRQIEEQRRREWNHRYGFDGARADPTERAAEDERRERYRIASSQQQQQQQQRAPSLPLSVPSIPTAPDPHPRSQQSRHESPISPSNLTTSLSKPAASSTAATGVGAGASVGAGTTTA